MAIRQEDLVLLKRFRALGEAVQAYRDTMAAMDTDDTFCEGGLRRRYNSLPPNYRTKHTTIHADSSQREYKIQ